MSDHDLENLEAVILAKIIEEYELDDIDPSSFPYDATLFESDREKTEVCLDLDSIGALQLVVMIYDKWGIKAEQKDFPKLRTVSAIADFIRERAGGNT
ncbi:MAG: phosphopantetheine-binding protein [Chitinispirillia bacterium]|nr:phosphopantetheine-binding protein [Chitinispirillia bacterium]MCL2267709.1 phosphopantetheine-binding protein [Chitinispirillia bacterium]